MVSRQELLGGWLHTTPAHGSSRHAPDWQPFEHTVSVLE
jgi:hypothetical protein